MKIKILAGEYLFDEQGLHVLDDRGFALKADAEVEVEVIDYAVERVLSLLAKERVNIGLDAEGSPISDSEEQPQEHTIFSPDSLLSEEE